MRDGIDIQLLPEEMLHAKAAVVDDDWMTIGSANLDPISLFSCLEINLGVAHPPAVTHVAAVIEAYRSRSRRLTYSEWKQRPWLERLLDRLWYRLRRWYASWG